jgi:BirA family biotin operon repressor/biotin-[acetyl-CoA-carboxylase] ligase
MSMRRKPMVERIQEILHTKRLGKKIFFIPKIGSTNEWAKRLAEYGAEEGTVVVAGTQTAGRGRVGKEWISPRGGLWFSVIFRPCRNLAQTEKLVFVGSLAVAEILNRDFGLKAETKWPNDVVVNGHKICGILGETNFVGKKSTFTVLGIGINANFQTWKHFPAKMRSTVTSIRDELNRRVVVDKLFQSILESLEKYCDQLDTQGFDPVLNRWKQYAGFLSKKILVHCEKGIVRGAADDVDEEGALVLRLENGSLRRFIVGAVSLLVE